MVYIVTVILINQHNETNYELFSTRINTDTNKPVKSNTQTAHDCKTTNYTSWRII